FKYFDDRDLLGFVDGTENPSGNEAAEAVFVGSEDPPFAGGSYVIVQKYVHDLQRWNQLPTEVQEKIVRSRKVDDIELDDATKPPTRTTRSPTSWRTARKSKSSVPTCRSDPSPRVSLEPTSSATAARRGPLSGCSKTCS